MQRLVLDVVRPLVPGFLDDAFFGIVPGPLNTVIQLLVPTGLDPVIRPAANQDGRSSVSFSPVYQTVSRNTPLSAKQNA